LGSRKGGGFRYVINELSRGLGNVPFLYTYKQSFWNPPGGPSASCWYGRLRVQTSTHRCSLVLNRQSNLSMCGTTQKGFLTPPTNRGLHPNIPNTDRLRKFIATYCAFQYCVVRLDFASIDRLHIIICRADAVAVPPRRAAARPPPLRGASR